MSSFTNIPGGYITPNGNVVMSNGDHGVVTPNGNVIVSNAPLPLPTPAVQKPPTSSLMAAIQAIKAKRGY